MVSATKMREYLWVKGGIYLALALILSGALMLMASANMAYADTVTNKDGSKTETQTLKRTIVFSDGAGGQVADTVIQEATFTRTWYPDFEEAPAWQEVDFAAVSCPTVANFRAGQSQVAAVTGVSPANASSKLRDVTVTYTRTSTNTGTGTGGTVPTVTSPVSSSRTSSSSVSPTAPTVSTSTSTSSSSSSGLPGPVSSSTTVTPQPVTPTTSTTASSSSSSSGLPGPATPTTSTTASTSSSTLQAPVSTTTSTPTPVSTTAAPSGNQESANQEPQITDYAWQIGAAVLGAGLIGAVAYIATTRRKADTPPSDPGTPTPSA